jgi:hypothetical protein
MPQWLMVVSWLAIILGVLTAIVIALHEVAHPQHMKIMNVVWPVTGLYVPVIGWWAYTALGRPSPKQRRQRLDVSVKNTSVCIVDEMGKIVREVKVVSEPEALLLRFSF